MSAHNTKYRRNYIAYHKEEAHQSRWYYVLNDHQYYPGVCVEIGLTSFSSPKADSRGTAYCDGTIVSFVKCTLVDKMLLCQWHIIQRVEVKILVISEDKDNVWPRSRQWSSKWVCKRALNMAVSHWLPEGEVIEELTGKHDGEVNSEIRGMIRIIPFVAGPCDIK